MKTTFSAALLLVCLTLIIPSAQACSCAPPPPPKKALEQAAAVFSGKITDLKVVNDQKVVTFEVDRVWKGKVGATVVVTTHIHGATCGYGFNTKGDGTYLVYAYETKAGLATNLCTRTTAMANAGADIKELGDGEKPKKEEKAKE